MILSAALLMVPAVPAQDVSGAADEAVTNQIVVIGSALKSWKGRVKKRNGELVCDVRKSTGDAQIDRIGCDAMLTCMAPIVPEIEAVATSDQPRKQRKAAMAKLVEAQGECVLDQRAAGIDALARKRATR